MIQTKREEWEQACSDYPELSPFTLLKLSMVRYGAVLSPMPCPGFRILFIPLARRSPLASALKGGRGAFDARANFAAGWFLCIH